MKKHINTFIYTFCTFLAILIYFKIIFKENSYNILLLLLFCILYHFFNKNNEKYSNTKKNFSMIISILLSTILSVGNIASSYIYEPAINIFTLKNIVYLSISIIGFSFLFYKICGCLLPKISKIKITEEHNNMTLKTYLLLILTIILSYSIYFFRYYPAIMTPDSYYVLHYANNFILSDFHPFGHTWFVGIFLHLGKFLFKNINMAVGFVTIIQMICMASMFAYSIKYLYNKGLKKKYCIIILLIYSLSPLHAHYSITIWRDIIFGGSFILLLITLYEFINSKKIQKKYVILFIISILIMLFFRNNGIYIFIFIIPFIIIFIKENRKKLSFLCCSLLIFYFIIKGPIFNYFNVEKTTSVEAFSIPLQQMARVIASGRKIDVEDKKYLNKLFEYDKVSKMYNPAISDPIKNLTNNEVLSNNKTKFIKTYSDLLLKYPNVYFDAYFLQTLGYWYPDVIYWATAGESTQMFDSEKINSSPLTPEWYNKIIDLTVSRKIPLNNLIWSVGLQFIILLISTSIMIYLRKYKYLICYIPLYGLWLSIMVATPVFCELRYVYGLFVCTPFIIILPFIENNKSLCKKECQND